MMLDDIAKFRCRAKDRTRFEAAAREHGLSFSEYTRRALTAALRGVTGDGARSDFALLRRHANALEALVGELQPGPAGRVQAAAAELRRIAARHL